MVKAESSAAAAKNDIKANVNGVGSGTYDLPWSYFLPPLFSSWLIPGQGGEIQTGILR